VLDDRDARIGEVGRQVPCRLGVEEVVVGQLLAAELLGGPEAVRGAALDVVGGGLVRVLAVAQVLRLDVDRAEALGEGLVAGEPVGTSAS
jgi:hypothetical protein